MNGPPFLALCSVPWMCSYPPPGASAARIRTWSPFTTDPTMPARGPSAGTPRAATTCGLAAFVTQRAEPSAVDERLAPAFRVPGLVANEEVHRSPIDQVIEQPTPLGARRAGRGLGLPLKRLPVEEAVGASMFERLAQVHHQDGLRRVQVVDVLVPGLSDALGVQSGPSIPWIGPARSSHYRVDSGGPALTFRGMSASSRLLTAPWVAAAHLGHYRALQCGSGDRWTCRSVVAELQSRESTSR